MNFVVSLVQILLAAVLHLSTVKGASISAMEKSKNEVVPFLEVLMKSECKPRDTLVDVYVEHPGDTEFIYIPSCVVLSRCGGCCQDEAMECVPTQTKNVTLQVMRSRPMVSQHTLELKFTEHTQCACREKQGLSTAKKQYQCAPCSERRKRLYIQDPLTCTCSCKYSHLDCTARKLELNERTCRCERPRR
ncbi:vascular endothelial growth factor A-A [Boleophthalmus pectinirostris]|uniref:vascular endothelial growth factor A-A n=1 Tax=Boleophthalmus pectinirostris TaxID=150288 RepID=UPI000A1C65FB|nr:vascular endothelial growth factor A-A [Boleophthalmus pectinirostris]